MAVVGFDTAKVGEWLAGVAQLQEPLEWEQLPGGHSNLTYLIRDLAGREVVIRRPPLGPLLPKAHDMRREYRLIEALWPTAVPVPEPIVYCDDRAVAETHFYVMGRSQGQALFQTSAVERWLATDDARRRAGEVFIDGLAALHAVDPGEAGLADLGRPDSYVARQLHTWHSSWTSQAANADHDDPRVHALHAELSSRIPEQGPGRIVHGDYGPHNALFLKTGEMTAVLDWEIATLGDPLADLAYAVTAWVGPGDAPVDIADSPTTLPGFPRRQDLIERYVTLSGADLSQFDYYRAFNFWKRACIVQGVYARYRSGQKSTEGVNMEAMLARVDRLLGAAGELL
ncbi:MAG: phosphotransferase family protein [Acidimicrobiaceae bacterium]|nr:phosphotransferase family protein [Acidimicrobiaceae bacterium]